VAFSSNFIKKCNVDSLFQQFITSVLTDKQSTDPVKHILQSQKKINLNDCLIQNYWIK